jgi:asparagine synthase (glutamine-hydrolysing)
MSYAEDRLWIVFNGEIYNHIELRSELRAMGHSFVGTSDTEVLLAAYAQWGPGCLDRLRGMFAFVLVDRSSGRILAARDRFGIKPLYYRHTPTGGLRFGSEIKQLLHPDERPPANGPRLYDFLNFGMQDHTQETMFADVLQVPPGGLMSAHLGTAMDDVVPQTWWTLAPGHFSGSFSEASDHFRSLMADSVREHLRADVPVGSCLSGGLDSSAIVCLMHGELDEAGATAEQRTFTATSRDARVDETDWAQLIISSTEARSFMVEPDMDAIPGWLGQMVWHMDEPFGSTSIFAQWKVFELAQQSQTKVLLDGQGADEQLAGYLNFFAWRMVELAMDRRMGALRSEVSALRSIHPQVLRSTVLSAGYLLAPAQLGRTVGRAVKAAGQSPDSWLDRARLGVSGYPDPLGDAGGRARSVRGLSMAQLTASNLPMLLHYEDRDSMAHSVEARVPFLDHRVVEFAVSLPSDFLIQAGETKRVLREAMRGILPERTRTRTDKIGFQTAEEAWMRSNPAIVLSLVDRAVQSLGGAVRPTAMTRTSRVLHEGAPFDYWIWRVLCAGAWAEAFDVRMTTAGAVDHGR